MIFYSVNKISAKTAKEYIHKNHYSHGSSHSPSPCYGLFDKDLLIGVLMFACPCSERVRSSIFGEEYKGGVLELHRLHILDITPKNTESWFISKCFELLEKDRPDINAVISFSDPTENHFGIIYKATNAYFYGQSPKTTFYRDESGRLRHPRQSGKNISKKEAELKGWLSEKRLGKLKYFWLMGSKSNKRFWKNKLKVKILPYLTK